MSDDCEQHLFEIREGCEQEFEGCMVTPTWSKSRAGSQYAGDLEGGDAEDDDLLGDWESVDMPGIDYNLAGIRHRG